MNTILTLLITLCTFGLSLSAYAGPTITPFHQGYLKVSPLHELWYAEYGNPKGMPVIVLHGGPGAGSNELDVSLFDTNYWRVILLDQRGSRLSKPVGELKDNTTAHLVSDLEVLRTQLDIDKWVVFGGSWGSLLAIAYGETHPDHILGFILRGIVLGRDSENKNLWYGMRDTFPDVWEKFNNYIPKNQQGDLIKAYHNLVMNPDKAISTPAARSFFQYDITCSFLKISPEQLEMFMKDETLVLGLSRMFIHYSFNKFFLKENQLIDEIGKINHLPLIIINGRYDTITRAQVAYELHTLWPSSTLVIVEAAGHSAREPGITDALRKATEDMKNRLNN